MSSQQQLEQYSRQEYWDSRYASGDEHEWSNFEYTDLKEILDDLLPPTSSNPHLLHLGCGTSTLTQDLYEAGYRRQTSLDFSTECIKTMRERFSREGINWLVQDVRHMKDIADGSVDVAVDKVRV